MSYLLDKPCGSYDLDIVEHTPHNTRFDRITFDDGSVYLLPNADMWVLLVFKSFLDVSGTLDSYHDDLRKNGRVKVSVTIHEKTTRLGRVVKYPTFKRR